VKLPRGAKLSARISDISLSGCHIDTLNPIRQGSEVRLRIAHRDEIFVAIRKFICVSAGLGMVVAFTTYAQKNGRGWRDGWKLATLSLEAAVQRSSRIETTLGKFAASLK
jgi:hypothetical protein